LRPSCASYRRLSIGRISGNPSGGFSSCGWAGVTLPNSRAKAICSACPIRWSRKKTTLCVSRADRISATVAAPSWPLRSTPEISAPM